MWTVAEGIRTAGGRPKTHRHDDGRRLAVFDHRHDPEPVFAAEEPFAARAWVPATLIRPSNRTIDESEVSDGRVLLEDLRVDDRRKHHRDPLGRLRSQDDFHD